MAAARKIERLLSTLKDIVEFAKNIPPNATASTIEIYIKNLEKIREDVAETIDASTSLKESDSALYWKTTNDAFFELMPKLLEALRKLKPPIATVAENNLQTSVLEVLEGQKLFFEKLPDALQKSSSNKSIKVPALNIDCFSGGENNYDKWPPFYNIFKASVHDNESISIIHKFSLLRSNLKDDARDLISHLIVSEENYAIAWEKLCKRYHKPKKIALCYINRFLNIEGISAVSSNGLRRITDFADEQLRGLDALGKDYGTRDPWLVAMLLSKVDSETRTLWSIESINKDNFSINELIDFLTNRCDALEDSQPVQGNSSKSKKSTKSFHSEFQYNKCPNCNENHPLFRCFKFLATDVETKRNRVKELNVCFNCLKKNHTSIDCRSKATCQTCHKRHHTLLHMHDQHQAQPNKSSTHIATINSSNQGHSSFHNSNSSLQCELQQPIHQAQTTPLESNSTNPSSSTSTYHASNFSNQALLPTILAFARDSSGNLQQVRALLDSASMSSFISEQCCQKLGLQRTHACMSIDALSCTTAGSTRGKVELKIYSKSDLSTPITLDALVLKKITSKLPDSYIDTSNWLALKSLVLADSTFNRPSKVDILIGVNLFYKLHCPTPIINISEDIIAQKTIFGWIVAGQSTLPNQKFSSFVTNIDHQTEVHCFLQQFWKLEEVPECLKRNADDLKIEKHFVENLHEDDDGKFVIRLPFNEYSTPLGHSKSAALSRLFAIERKFINNPRLFKDYRDFMRQYQILGHMDEVNPLEYDIDESKSYYLPHHAVIKNDSLTTKTRVVFDGSCKTSSGVSLNDCLLAGPTIQNDLASILLTFRSYNIAFISDIEKMYRMVKVHSDDRDFQRIVWREKSTNPVKIYRLNTVTYGTTSAPYQAIRSLVEIGNRIHSKYPRASEAILHDFYVDDLLSGSDTVEGAIQLKQEISDALQCHGMHLRKWTSNSKEFLQSIPQANIETSSFELIDQDVTPTVKTLGLYWNPNTDMFTFIVNNTNELCSTKRQILSLASKVFDPLGWLAPTTVMLKMFLQSLWLTKLDWDDDLPEQLLIKWKKIQVKLKGLENVTIPRCLQVMPHQNHIQLHAFSDASEQAYGAVLYFKTSCDSTSKIHLVTSKSKVAPIKQISLARLELCAALLLSKLVKWVLRIFAKYSIELFAWCDSTIVLAWLDNHPRKWSSFVANRTSQIIEIVPRKHWRHITSKHNPADLVSRGVEPQNLASNQLWWNGPPWLNLNEIDWPKSATKVMEIVPETRATQITLTTITPPLTIYDRLCENFSSYEKIKKSLCVFDRFIQFLRNKKANNSPINASEMQKAEINLLLWAQKYEFSAEIASLQKSKPIPHSSTLASLSPFLDEEGEWLL